MSERARIVIGVLVVIVLVALGLGAYRRFGAPIPATPTPTASAGVEASGPSIVTAEGNIVPARSAELAFRVSGRVVEILVKEGQIVETGEALIRLEAADLQAAVAQAEAALAYARAQRDQVADGPRSEEIAAAEANYRAAQSLVGEASARLNELLSGATADQIAAAEAEVASAAARQKEAQIAYDRIIENIEFLAGPTEEQGRFNLEAANEALAAAQAQLDQVRQGASQEQIDAARSAVGAAASQRDAAKAQLDLLQAGSTEAQQAAAGASVRQAQAALDAAQSALAQATLIAPFQGTIGAINIEVGEITIPGAPILVLADFSRWRMETDDLSETDVVLVQPGQSATVTLDAFPDQAFPGAVSEISPLSEANRGNVTYRVTIDLDPTEAGLRWGMTAFVDIRVGGE